ncbi:MAG: hypothetical protein QJR09_05235 [Micrococcus sp.]|nr:hypothetical protein [Micrococcus sp.]
MSTETLAGVTATLTEWPSLGGLEVDSTDIPGRDGRFFGGSSRRVSRFVFDVLVEGSTPAEAFARRDAFVGLLDPSRGPRALTVEADAGWEWPDVLVAEEINWGRYGWARGLGFRLRAEVALETQADPSAREIEPAYVVADPSLAFTLDAGNTSAYPRLLFEVDGSAGPWVVSIGDFSVSIDGGGLPAGRVVDLDWDRMMFSVTDASGVRLASAVGRMSNYDRPELKHGETVTVSVTPAPTGGALFYPNARRI